MKRIQQGNDITIKWNITKNDDVVLDNVKVVLVDALKRNALIKYTVEDNLITVKFYGKDQRTLGIYNLVIINNEGEKNMSTLVHPNVFNLCKILDNKIACGEDEDNIVTETIELDSDITTGWETDLSNYYTKDEINAIVDAIGEPLYENDRPTILFHNDGISLLSNDAEYVDSDQLEEVNQRIPKKVSQLLNDAGYLTKHQSLASKQDVINDLETIRSNSALGKDAYNALSGKQDKLSEEQMRNVNTAIPTKISYFTNDSGYLTSHQSLEEYLKKSELPINVSHFTNDAGYITEHQDLSGKQDKLTEEQINRLNQPIPTKLSEFINDSGFITEHQSLDGKQDKLTDEQLADLNAIHTLKTINNESIIGVGNIELPIPDLENYYSKPEIDSIINGIELLDADDYYNKTAIDELLSNLDSGGGTDEEAIANILYKQNNINKDYASKFASYVSGTTFDKYKVSVNTKFKDIKAQLPKFDFNNLEEALTAVIIDLNERLTNLENN